MKKPTTEETNAFLVDLKTICNKHNIFIDTCESGDLYLIKTKRLSYDYKIIEYEEPRYEKGSVWYIHKDYWRAQAQLILRESFVRSKERR